MDVYRFGSGVLSSQKKQDGSIRYQSMGIVFKQSRISLWNGSHAYVTTPGTGVLEHKRSPY
jgi:hypothetical protein